MAISGTVQDLFSVRNMFFCGAGLLAPFQSHWSLLIFGLAPFRRPSRPPQLAAALRRNETPSATLSLTLLRRKAMPYPQSQSVPLSRIESYTVDWNAFVTVALAISIATIIAMLFAQ